MDDGGGCNRGGTPGMRAFTGTQREGCAREGCAVGEELDREPLILLLAVGDRLPDSESDGNRTSHDNDGKQHLETNTHTLVA